MTSTSEDGIDDERFLSCCCRRVVGVADEFVGRAYRSTTRSSKTSSALAEALTAKAWVAGATTIHFAAKFIWDVGRKVINPRVAYIDLFNGAKSYFGRSDRSKSGASFSATCLVSGLTIIDIAGLLVLLDNVLFGQLELTNIVLKDRASGLAISLGVVAVHFFVSNRLGVYSAPIPAPPATWPRNALTLAALGLGAFLAGILIGLLGR